MTFRERLQRDCPGLSEDAIDAIVARMCPSNFGYEKNAKPCVGYDDAEFDRVGCWNREIPGTKPTNKTGNNEREENNMNESTPTNIIAKGGYFETFDYFVLCGSYERVREIANKLEKQCRTMSLTAEVESMHFGVWYRVQEPRTGKWIRILLSTASRAPKFTRAVVVCAEAVEQRLKEMEDISR